MNIRPRLLPPPVQPVLSESLKNEISSLYSVSVVKNGKPYHKGGDYFGSLAETGDRDRLHGGHCSMQPSRRSWTLGNRQVEAPEGFGLDDITYDSQDQKVATHGFNDKRQRWEVVQFELAGEATPVGQVVYSSPEPFQGIEWGADGRLLLARDQQVLALDSPGQLIASCRCPGPVQDLNTLSDGSLLIKVESNSPLQSDLLLWAPGQEQPQTLPMYQTSRTGGWQELASSDGHNSLAARRDGQDWQLHPRDGDWEYGDMLEDLRATMARGGKLEPTSLGWSPDGRFFKATSLRPRGLNQELCDSVVWDSRNKQVYLLPGIDSLEFPAAQGPIRIAGLGQQLELQPEQLGQLEQQAWYQGNLKVPSLSISQGGQRATLTYRGSRPQEVLTGPGNWQFKVTPDHQLLAAMAQDHRQAKLWDLRSGETFETPRGYTVQWDEQAGGLAIAGPEGQGVGPVGKLSELSRQPWYRQALEQTVLPQAPEGSVVREAEGTRYNGLRLPKRQELPQN